MENLCIKRVRSSTTVGGIHTYIHFLKTHFYLKLFALSNLPSFAWKYNYLMKNKIHILLFFFTFLISSQTLLILYLCINGLCRHYNKKINKKKLHQKGTNLNSPVFWKYLTFNNVVKLQDQINKILEWLPQEKIRSLQSWINV